MQGKVLIAGAGVGGLTLGVALTRAGIECEIFEREPELRAAGAGLLLQTAPLQALAALELNQAALAAGHRIGTGYLKTANGAVLQATAMDFLEAEFGQPNIAIHRARLQSLLREAASSIPVHLNKKLASFETTAAEVTAVFTDGTKAVGALLVGADGLRSAVRQQLLGDTPLRYGGYSTYRGVTEGEVAGEVCESWGQGRRFGYAPLAPGEVYWFAVFNAPAGEAHPHPKLHLRELFGNFHAPIPALIEATPLERILRTDIHDRVPVPRWSGERVTLLGDAAHPTTPNLGQGAGMAIEDAVVLAHQLQRHQDLATALRAYEKARMPKTKRIVETSWQVGRVGQYESALACFARNTSVRLMPASIGQRQLRENACFSLD